MTPEISLSYLHFNFAMSIMTNIEQNAKDINCNAMWVTGLTVADWYHIFFESPMEVPEGLNN